LLKPLNTIVGEIYILTEITVLLVHTGSIRLSPTKNAQKPGSHQKWYPARSDFWEEMVHIFI